MIAGMPGNVHSVVRTVERTIDIAAPPEAVDAVVHDPALQPRWRSSLVSWRQEPPGPVAVGTRYHGVSRVAGREVESRYEVVAVERGRGSTVRGVGSPVPLEASYRSDPIAGGTRFTYRITLEGRGLQRIAERVAAAIITREAARDLPRLKALVEGSRTG